MEVHTLGTVVPDKDRIIGSLLILEYTGVIRLMEITPRAKALLQKNPLQKQMSHRYHVNFQKAKELVGEGTNDATKLALASAFHRSYDSLVPVYWQMQDDLERLCPHMQIRLTSGFVTGFVAGIKNDKDVVRSFNAVVDGIKHVRRLEAMHEGQEPHPRFSADEGECEKWFLNYTLDTELHRLYGLYDENGKRVEYAD